MGDWETDEEQEGEHSPDPRSSMWLGGWVGGGGPATDTWLSSGETAKCERNARGGRRQKPH